MLSHHLMVSVPTQHEISDLPQDILQTIFKYLSTNERKSVKLVCKSWFEACNFLLQTYEEVLNCIGIYQVDDIYQILNGSERRFLNLKFDQVDFDVDTEFWKNNKSRIRSIIFIDCWFPNGILEDIIMFCENLYHLSLTSHEYYMSNGSRLQPLEDLQRVFENGIIRESVKSLEMNITRQWHLLSDHTVHQLFSLFPRVKVLKLFCYDTMKEKLEKINLNPSEFSRTDFMFAPVLNYLVASTDRIEKLLLDFSHATFSSGTLHIILQTLTAMKRLTELTINFARTPDQESLENFYCSKPLKSLAFHNQRGSLDQFLLRLLLSNPSLEHLKIYSLGSLKVTKHFYEKLVFSGLKSCEIELPFGSILIRDSDSFATGFPAGKKATEFIKLSVTMLRPDEGLLLFLQYFQNLHHLKLNEIYYNELETLLKYQTKLKSLILRNGKGWRTIKNPAAVFKNAFYQLPDLEHLELIWTGLSPILFMSLSPGSALSNMKYLKLDMMQKDKLLPKNLEKLAAGMPHLEGLYANFCGAYFPFDLCIKLCSKLSRLRYFLTLTNIHFDNSSSTDEHYQKLFSICPSLRLLRYRTNTNGSASNYRRGDENDILVYIDTMRNEVKSKRKQENDDWYVLAEPNISGYIVDWLGL